MSFLLGDAGGLDRGMGAGQEDPHFDRQREQREDGEGHSSSLDAECLTNDVVQAASRPCSRGPVLAPQLVRVFLGRPHAIVVAIDPRERVANGPVDLSDLQGLLHGVHKGQGRLALNDLATQGLDLISTISGSGTFSKDRRAVIKGPGDSSHMVHRGQRVPKTRDEAVGAHEGVDQVTAQAPTPTAALRGRVGGDKGERLQSLQNQRPGHKGPSFDGCGSQPQSEVQGEERRYRDQRGEDDVLKKPHLANLRSTGRQRRNQPGRTHPENVFPSWPRFVLGREVLGRGRVATGFLPPLDEPK